MQVSVYNLLEQCPDTCSSSKIEAEALEYSIVNDAHGICVIVSCDHVDVCKLRREDE